ncbi:MAG: hypothetical protein HY582_00120 [Candidatus Omnitrophica bacterium]|nr:hypothetical protein [Candidatus Omnitrophota bacterium]
MTRWFFILIILSLAQVAFYHISIQSFLRIAPRLWLAMVTGLLASGFVWRVFLEIGMERWLAVIIPFLAYVLGEFFPFAFDYPKDEIGRKHRSTPSLISFSVVFISIAWFSDALSASFSEAYTKTILLISASILLTILLVGTQERLFLLNVPKQLEGFPILLIVTALLWISFYGFVLMFDAGGFLIHF